MVHILELSILMCSGPWKLFKLSACLSAGLAAAGFHVNICRWLGEIFFRLHSSHRNCTAFCLKVQKHPLLGPTAKASRIFIFIYFEEVKQISKSESKTSVVFLWKLNLPIKVPNLRWTVFSLHVL